MTNGYRISEQDELHYVTFQIVKWIDIFTRQVYRDIVIDCLSYSQKNKALEIYAYVIMSNHVHLLLRCGRGRLSDTIREIKSYTARKIIEAVNTEAESRREWMLNIFGFCARQHKRNEQYQIWTHENHAEIVYSNSFMDQKIRYIHENPVQAGIVERAEDYLYSSARNYSGLEGLIEIEAIYVPVEKAPLLRSLR